MIRLDRNGRYVVEVVRIVATGVTVTLLVVGAVALVSNLFGGQWVAVLLIGGVVLAMCVSHYLLWWNKRMDRVDETADQLRR